MHGMHISGMANCGKHFPGHGYVRGDSHLDIPVDERPLHTVLTDDAMPYQWLSSSLTSVMPAHVIYSQVDARPAGFSARWLQDILRGQLGFQGAVFSDDLSMAAARVIDGQPVSYTTAALAALRAGCDMVLLCNQSLNGGGEAVDELLNGLSEAIVRGEWEPRETSEERRQALLPTLPALGWEDVYKRQVPSQLCALSVNLNKVATVRNTRHLGIPSITRAATLCLEAGAQGITVHPRPDERHIRAHDVTDLAALLAHWPGREFNICLLYTSRCV